MVFYASVSLYTKQKGQRTRVLSVWELGLLSTMVNIKFKGWVKYLNFEVTLTKQRFSWIFGQGLMSLEVCHFDACVLSMRLDDTNQSEHIEILA